MESVLPNFCEEANISAVRTAANMVCGMAKGTPPKLELINTAQGFLLKAIHYMEFFVKVEVVMENGMQGTYLGPEAMKQKYDLVNQKVGRFEQASMKGSAPT